MEVMESCRAGFDRPNFPAPTCDGVRLDYRTSAEEPHTISLDSRLARIYAGAYKLVVHRVAHMRQKQYKSLKWDTNKAEDT